jgi:hypothetical protein
MSYRKMSFTKSLGMLRQKAASFVQWNGEHLFPRNSGNSADSSNVTSCLVMLDFYLSALGYQSKHDDK